MLSSTGLRIERLLYFGLILIFLCWVETYLSATAVYFANTDNRVMDTLLQRLNQERSALELAFDKKASENDLSARQKRADKLRSELGLAPRVIEDTDADSYLRQLQKIIRESQISIYSLDSQLYASIVKLFDTSKSPKEIIDAVTVQRNLAMKNTATVMGIESPRFLSLQYGSTDFKIPSLYLAVILLLVIYPLAVVWLGSFYITRQRELMMIRLARNHKATFPHILNWVVVDTSRIFADLGDPPSLKQRRRDRKIISIATVVFRCLIILMIVALIVAPICYSSFSLFEVTSPPSYFTALGGTLLFIVCVLSIFLLLQEAFLLRGKVFYE